MRKRPSNPRRPRILTIPTRLDPNRKMQMQRKATQNPSKPGVVKMQVYLKKGDVEGRTKYVWSTQPGFNVVATLEVITVAPNISIEKIVNATPSVWGVR